MILSKDDYASAAQLLGCEPAAIGAVAECESAGSGFLPDGRPKILFGSAHLLEAHQSQVRRDASADLVARLAHINLAGSANFSMNSSDTLTLIQKADGNWYELCRSDNT